MVCVCVGNDAWAAMEHTGSSYVVVVNADARICLPPSHIAGHAGTCLIVRGRERYQISGSLLVILFTHKA